MDEKPIIGYFINAGIYCLDPKLIDYIPEDQYYDFNVLINQAISDELSIGSFPITEYWIDIGQMADYQKAANDYYNIFG
jgi:NDP-sugar pyrophosphorylase family protein